MYPNFVPVKLSQRNLIDIVSGLKGIIDDEVLVRGFTGKMSISGLSNGLKKSVREWTREEFDKIIEDIDDRRIDLRSVDLEFYHRMGDIHNIVPRAVCKVKTTGEVDVTGYFEIVFQQILSKIAADGVKKFEFLSHRGLRDSNYSSKPLSIMFNKPIFEDLMHIRSFVKLLSRYPHSMYSIEHGNPYAQVVLTDMYDGSSFTVCAIPPAKIALIPGLTASEAAFDRLVNYTYEQLREGTLAEFSAGVNSDKHC
jgi:hypothetical protein